MCAVGAKACTTSAATCALLWPTWLRRNRNWRLRLLVSIVSRSIWWGVAMAMHVGVVLICEQGRKKGGGKKVRG